MRRSILFLSLSLLLALPAAAQNACNLGITLSCDSEYHCSSTVTNNGRNTCSGDYVVGFWVLGQGQNQASVTDLNQNLGLSQCFDSSTIPVGFGFAICTGPAALGPGGSFNMSSHIQLNGAAASEILAAALVSDPVTGDDLGFTYIFNNASTTLTCTPQPRVPPVAQSGVPYTVTWIPVTDPSASFTIDESTAADFSANLVSTPVSGLSMQFQHTVGSATTYFYRVRANSCSGVPGTNSPPVVIIVQPVPTVTGRSGDVVTSVGSTTPVSIKVFIPGQSGKQALDVPFTASTDKPYLTVTPSSGTIPPGGTTVTVTANPSNLPPGANTGTLQVTTNGAATKTSVSVSLVTPVAPGSKSLPASNALIIPAAGHTPGANGPFQSDVRLTNGSLGPIAYQITYTPTKTDGTKNGKTTTVSVDPGQTIAMNDIVNDFFGIGAAGDSGFGALEIRPLNTSSNANYASSRTFTFNTKGTFGQFIAAIPFSTFATKASLVPLPGSPPPATPVLSFQQVTQSADPTKGFHTNLGLLEGSGSAASGNIKLYNDAGVLQTTVPYSLQPGEHKQQGFGDWGLPNIDDGRIEVSVESATGAVSGYASVLDNITNDPLAVMPVQVSQVNATRYILPGMAALPGVNNFHSDIRVYNGGASTATVNATFYPQNNGTPVPVAPFSVAPGEVKAFDDVVANLFSSPGLGGSIVMTTSAASSVVATGRTYTIDSSGGTFGQFIPGVTPTQGIGLSDRPLQILQLEQSDNFRSNLGIAELSGSPANVTQCGGPLPNPATVCVHVTAYIPDSKITTATDVPLGPNQFTQLGRVLASLYPGQSIYNARISVEVTAGTGRVTSYGSVIDNLSLDPTYVPAQ